MREKANFPDQIAISHTDASLVLARPENTEPIHDEGNGKNQPHTELSSEA